MAGSDGWLLTSENSPWLTCKKAGISVLRPQRAGILLATSKLRRGP